MRSLLKSSTLVQRLRGRLLVAPFKRDLVYEDFDNPDVINTWRATLERDRRSAKYQSVFRKSSPLVSICVTTADRAEILAARALTSIQQQSYKNLEVIIVGDRCDDNTEAAVSQFRDSRFRFFNLSTRGPYPRPGYDRWLVAGTSAANWALEHLRGDLITHLDEDDTYEPQRIEILVRELQRNKADLVFHPFSWENDDRSWMVRGNGRAEHRQTTTGSILYHNWFARIPWDVYAFRLGEAGDWNRLRKFKALGANLHYVDQVLATHWKYPLREAFCAKPDETFLD